MKYQKFNDPAAILLRLCLPFDEEDNVLLLRKSLEFQKNEQYKRDYLIVLKRFYLDNFSDIQKGRYVLRPFKELDKKFEVKLREKAVGNNIPLLPECDIDNRGGTLQDKQERIRKILERVRKREI